MSNRMSTGHEYAEGSNPFKQPVPEQASGDDESHGEVNIILKTY